MIRASYTYDASRLGADMIDSNTLVELVEQCAVNICMRSEIGLTDTCRA